MKNALLNSSIARIKVMVKAKFLTRKKALLLLFGILSGLLLSTAGDHLLGAYLKSINYFKNEVPNITYIQNNLEYQTTEKISSIGIRNAEVTKQKPKKGFG